MYSTSTATCCQTAPWRPFPLVLTLAIESDRRGKGEKGGGKGKGVFLLQSRRIYSQDPIGQCWFPELRLKQEESGARARQDVGGQVA